MFKTIEWVSEYFGTNVILSGTSLLEFTQNNPNATYTFSDGTIASVNLNFILQYGLPDNYIHDEIGQYFYYNTTTSVTAAIDANDPVMAAIDNGAHQVMITGYNNDGTYTYFDPAQGTYYKQAPSAFTDIITITGSK